MHQLIGSPKQGGCSHSSMPICSHNLRRAEEKGPFAPEQLEHTHAIHGIHYTLQSNSSIRPHICKIFWPFRWWDRRMRGLLAHFWCWALGHEQLYPGCETSHPRFSPLCPWRWLWIHFSTQRFPAIWRSRLRLPSPSALYSSCFFTLLSPEWPQDGKPKTQTVDISWGFLNWAIKLKSVEPHRKVSPDPRD